MKCYALMFAKKGQTASKMKQHRSHSFGGFIMVVPYKHDLKLKSLNAKLFVLLLRLLYKSHAAGHMQ